MFTGRAIGLLLGSVLAPGLSKACDHMLQLSISLGIIGICTGVVPILTDFWLLVVIVTLGGVIVGFNDALIQEYFMKQKIDVKSDCLLFLGSSTEISVVSEKSRIFSTSGL